MAMFSIIVPIYNVEKFIRRCVDSCITQTYRDFELILVDDGSADGCPAICDAYAAVDSRVRVIHKPNGGLVSARQEGTAAAKGRYIVCVDGDDYLDDDALASFADIVREKNPDLICCGAHFVFEEKTVDRVITDSDTYYSRADIEKQIFPYLLQSEKARYFSPSVWGKAIRRELYTEEQLSVDKRIVIGEDGACIIPCIYRADSLYIMSKCMYNYRQNNSSITKSHKVFDPQGPKLIAEHLAGRMNLDTFDFQNQMYRKIVHELFSVIVSQFYAKKSFLEIRAAVSRMTDEPIYKEALQKARFSGSVKAELMLLCLKYKVFLPIKLYAYIK